MLLNLCFDHIKDVLNKVEIQRTKDMDYALLNVRNIYGNIYTFSFNFTGDEPVLLAINYQGETLSDLNLPLSALQRFVESFENHNYYNQTLEYRSPQSSLGLSFTYNTILKARFLAEIYKLI